MKPCFKFYGCDDSKLVAKFLQSVIPSAVHVRLNNTIVVSTNEYQTAIVEGKQFIKNNNIHCHWIDGDCNSCHPLQCKLFGWG